MKFSHVTLSPRLRLALSLVVVAVIVVLHVDLKTTKIFRHPSWEHDDELGQFWSEAAFHYRFAKFFAENPPVRWKELSADRAVQHPDVINDWAEFTVAMEVPVGVLYRWWQPKIQFHAFVVWYDCIVSSLTLFSVFFLARALWRSDGAGLLATVLYATLYASYGRTVKNLFLREDFALPIIVLALFFTIRVLQENRPRDQIAAGIAWIVALASWHVTPFFLAVIIGAIALVFWTEDRVPQAKWLLLLLMIGGLIVPVLWAKQFVFSPPMCVIYGVALAVWKGKTRRTRLAVSFGATAAMVLIGSFLQTSYSEYAHVYQLFFYKLAYFGHKPLDPAALPFEARVLWESAFRTAAFDDLWRNFQLCLPLAFTAMVMYRHDKELATRTFLIVFGLLFFLGWIVVRYFTFLSFAIAVLAAGLMIRQGCGWKWAVFGVLGWQLALLNWKPLPRDQPRPEQYRAAVEWLQENVKSDTVVLATIAEAPVFWTHVGGRMILHSKFENRPIRLRYQEFLEAIYQDEEKFHTFARKYGADYFIFDEDGFLYGGTESRRYKANQLGPLAPESTVMRFAQHPDEMKYFKLELDTRHFTVFRVLK